mmetsp:Transcript_116277/g.323898  ORF Transcript_116277/g.323898 Transcript_116277/m.323898 type:complete len:130 (-) Transcript_116277:89-478(-)
MGCGAVSCFVLRTLATLAAASAGCFASCMLGMTLNDLSYGLEAHRLVSHWAELVPAPLATTGILTVPPSCVVLWASWHVAGGSSWARSVLSAFVGGLLLGVLLASPPRVYMDGIKDNDIQSRKESRSEL